MPLAEGWFLALGPDELRALRKLKGDRARRADVAKRIGAGSDRVLAVGVAWQFIELLARPKPRLFLGKSLHRAQSHRIEHLDGAAVAAAVGALATKEVERAFLAMDEAMWAHSYLPFWVRDEWAAEGRTTILDAEHAALVARGVKALCAFAARVAEGGDELVFFRN